MTKSDAGQGFDFGILDRRPLGLGKVAHLGLSKFDVVNRLLGQAGHDRFDLGQGQAKAGRRPLV